MRQFVISCPGLSLGKPGSTVTADRTGMDDDQLDQWVEAGFAVEIHGPPARATRTKEELMEAARDLDILGRSTMAKEELLAAVAEAEQAE